MLVDIEKIKEQTYVRLKFPSKTKARKFVRQLLVNGYSSAYPNDLKEIVGDKVLLIYKDTLLATDKIAEHKCQRYSDYVLPEQKSRKIKYSLLTRKSTVHYFSFDINNSDLSLRYYLDFVDRPTYIGKWLIKDKVKKQYLEVSDEQAEFVKRTMTNSQAQRVLGFLVSDGFQRTYWDNEGNIAGVTLNGKAQQLLCNVNSEI